MVPWWYRPWSRRSPSYSSATGTRTSLFNPDAETSRLVSEAKITVGIVGLGHMGGGMAERMLAAGCALVGYSRTRAKAEAFAAKGMIVAGSPREVAERSDLVITMVTNDAALLAVFEEPDGILAGLRAGKIVAEMSTTAPV